MCIFLLICVFFIVSSAESRGMHIFRVQFLFPHPDFTFLFFFLIYFPDKSGVLIVKILEMFEECTIQVAICQQLEQSPATVSSKDAAINAGEPILKVLFARETAAHLKSRPQDIIHIYPPWWVGRTGHACCSTAEQSRVGRILAALLWERPRGWEVSRALFVVICLWQLERHDRYLKDSSDNN